MDQREVENVILERTIQEGASKEDLEEAGVFHVQQDDAARERNQLVGQQLQQSAQLVDDDFRLGVTSVVSSPTSRADVESYFSRIRRQLRNERSLEVVAKLCFAAGRLIMKWHNFRTGEISLKKLVTWIFEEIVDLAKSCIDQWFEVGGCATKNGSS